MHESKFSLDIFLQKLVFFTKIKLRDEKFINLRFHKQLLKETLAFIEKSMVLMNIDQSVFAPPAQIAS